MKERVVWGPADYLSSGSIAPADILRTVRNNGHSDITGEPIDHHAAHNHHPAGVAGRGKATIRRHHQSLQLA